MYGLGGMRLPSVTSTSVTFAEIEDVVRAMLEDGDEGTLALLYRTLYHAGYRIAACDGQVARLKRKLEGKAP